MQIREHLEAAASRQHQVEHDEIDVLAQRRLGAADAVERDHHIKPVGVQPPLKEVDDPRLVLDHQDHPWHRHPSVAPIGR